MFSEPPTSDRDLELIAAAQSQCDAARSAPARTSSHPRSRSDSSLDVRVAAPTRTIDGYDLLAEMHRGGQGIVYEAVQCATRRRVAIKMLYDGPYTAAQRRRFEREVEILSQLRHPNIVTVFDSGTTDGRLYYVMDLIMGQPLDRWLAARLEEPSSGRSTGHRFGPLLHVFVKICDAINAAHLRGVIHRDLKPGNILIDGAGQPRVLDFGLAKFTLGMPDEPSHVPTMTAAGQFIGSLPWSSPEQSSGLPELVDARTDVYALGVLLYQALTGRFPYAVVGHPADVVQRIRSEEPAPLNRRGSSDGESGWPVSSARRPWVDGELETIVLKCLAKDPERRYQSAGDLGRDLQRYLRHEPIEAKRDSLAYVVRKHLRRHRLKVAALCAIFAACAVGFVVNLALWRRAESQRDAAQREALRATLAEQSARQQLLHAQAATRLLQGVFGSVAERFRGRDVTVQQMLEAFADDAIEKSHDDPEIEITLRGTVADAYLHLGELDRAEEHIHRGLELVRERLGEQGIEFATALNKRATLRQLRGQYADAEADYRAALDRCAQDSPESVELRHIVQYGLGNLLEQTGRLKQAEPLLRAAVAGFRDRPDDRDQFASSLRSLASLLASEGRFDEAEPLFLEVLGMQGEASAGEDTSIATTWNDYADLLRQTDRPREAVAYYRKALRSFRRAYGKESPHAVLCLGNLGCACLAAGQLDHAGRYLTESLALRRRLLPAGHRDLAIGMANLADYRMRTGDYAGAAELYGEALQGLMRNLPATHDYVVATRRNLAIALIGRGDEAGGARAESLLRELLATYSESPPRDAMAVGYVLAPLGGALLRQGRPREAEPVLREALAAVSGRLPADHSHVIGVRKNLARALIGQNDPLLAAEAEAILRDVLELRRAAPDSESEIATVLGLLGRALLVQQRTADATAVFRECLSLLSRCRPPGDAERREAEAQLAQALIAHGDAAGCAEAEGLLHDDPGR